MMRFDAETEQKSHVLNLERRGDTVFARIDERDYEIELRDLNGGAYLLIDGTAVYDCLVSTSDEQPNQFEVQLSGRTFAVTLVDPKRLRSGQSSGRENHGVARIQASMPGKVVRVLVEVGVKVEAGAGIVVVEAMKMQNEMKAPKSGTVVSLTAVPGATVNAGDVLAMIE
ncbi:MAG TPA: biotin/lipoyl-containing protein [Pyrinomonadaceae bacterium]